MANEVLTRDLTSGKVHRRVAVEGGYASLEADNLDDAGEFELIASIDGVEAADLCERCFPVTEPSEDDGA